MRIRNHIIAIVAGTLWLSACTTAPLPVEQRPASWARPIESPGLPNFHTVSDNVSRGGQPTREGFQQLQKMGIRTVINVREDDTDEGLVGDHEFNYVRIPMSAWNVNDDEIIAFLRTATNPANAPVFVHCHRGSDRSGVLCAMYRITTQRWTKDEAIREMTSNDMGFHSLYQNLISYVEHADIEKIGASPGYNPATKVDRLSPPRDST